MYVFNPAEINGFCSIFLQSVSQFDLTLYELYYNLYLTGLRYTELYNIDRWKYQNNDTVICTTAKGSFPRTFTADELSFPFYSSILRNENMFFTARYSTAIRYFSRFFPEPRIRCQNKEISTHIFRHNKAKQMKVQGKTDQEIQIYLGEISLENAQGYINSELYIN